VRREKFRHPGPPSKALIEVIDELTALSRYPMLDAGCGVGRNATALAARGLSIVCVDRNFDCLNSLIRSAAIQNTDLGRRELEGGRLHLVHADLKHYRWPFSQSCFGAIICVHFLDTNLFDAFRFSLVPNGYLYIETFGGHGGNYLDLPAAGQLRDLLSRSFQLGFYREKPVGPADSEAVSVKLLAKKRPTS
jgi:SAM-dependent methyltransferase